MRALFLKELRDNRFVFLAVLGMLAAITVAPTNFGKMWAGISTFMLIPVLCSHFGARMLASETEDDQLEMLLTLPISRSRMWLAKTGAGLLLTVAVTVLCALVQHYKDRHELRYPQAQVFFASVLLIYALGGFFSMVWQRGQAATFSAFGTFVMGLTTTSCVRELMHSPRATPLETLAWLTTFCLCATLACSYYVFTRADLLDVRDRRVTALRAGFYGVSASAFFFLLYGVR